MSLSKIAAIAASAVFIFSGAHAEESLWIYTKGSETLPKGETEVKLGVISRQGKADADYIFNDFRLEAEYGLTDRITVYGEAIVFNHDFSTNNPDLQPYFDTQGGEGGRYKGTNFAGYEVGVKYNILSPYKDPIGLAISVAFDHRDRYRLDGAKIDQDAIEITTHFQKNFLDNQLIFVFSPKVEWESRLSPGVIEKEISFDIAAGVSYRVAPRWFVGAEFRHQSDYLSPLDTVTGEYDPNLKPSKFPFKLGSQYQNGNYFGPTLHYAAPKWWVTAGVLWQFSGGGDFAFNRDGLNVDEHEKVNFGLTFGREF